MVWQLVSCFDVNASSYQAVPKVTLQSLTSHVDTRRHNAINSYRLDFTPMHVAYWPRLCSNVDFAYNCALALGGLRWHVSRATNIHGYFYLNTSAKITQFNKQ